MRASELPDVAVEALVAGNDTPALRNLAGADGEDSSVVAHLFQQVIAEAGIPTISKGDAARRYAELISQRIVTDRVSPLEGARLIIAAARRVDDSTFHDLDPFIYAESEAESRPEDTDFFVREIRAEAERWAQGKRDGVDPPQ
ncbi:MAG: hypothetical protein NVSMB62_28740 [Acidobacteriaceae bacterium]